MLTRMLGSGGFQQGWNGIATVGSGGGIWPLEAAGLFHVGGARTTAQTSHADLAHQGALRTRELLVRSRHFFTVWNVRWQRKPRLLRGARWVRLCGEVLCVHSS